jgi:hypothetical protein
VIGGEKWAIGDQRADPGLRTAATLPTLLPVTGRRHLLASALTMLTSVAWAIELATTSSPWTPAAAAVLGAGLLATGAVSVILVLVQSSPLGYWLACGLLVISGTLAAMAPVSPLWWAGVALIAVSGITLVDASLGGWIRRQPPATPIPANALALSLILLLVGPTAALVSHDNNVSQLPLLAAITWLLLFWYVRRWPGREWAPRLATPGLVVAGWLLPPPARWVWVIALTAAAALAWTKGTRLAVRPLVERGHPVPIPPELAPADVLHSAGIDERGRPRGERK